MLCILHIAGVFSGYMLAMSALTNFAECLAQNIDHVSVREVIPHTPTAVRSVGWGQRGDGIRWIPKGTDDQCHSEDQCRVVFSGFHMFSLHMTMMISGSVEPPSGPRQSWPVCVF